MANGCNFIENDTDMSVLLCSIVSKSIMIKVCLV